ncbi:HAMP domain-containing protein [Magnetospirillum molischianum]|uniref:Signal transduction histidine kinase n=1 Tax=Magnetospirillum molischianum DSM 120 TaxID=1150626 RepID=H8FSW1_MAGML|nr:HAMP domain-containing protein [Magnetospirillum molischianum]CCG41449.1 Signal transduction histidine kinase [Magnetospirillum molischianum DSM 120]
MVSRRLLRWIRTLPIAWRIPLVVALNVFVALAVGGLGWHAAKVTSDDIDELRLVQHSAIALSDIDARASRVQGLVRQYLANPGDDLLKEAMRASEELFVLMGDSTASPVPYSDDTAAMHEATRRFVAGFQSLKVVNADISRLYEAQIHQSIGEISGLYAILNSTARTRGDGELASALVKSHENFVGTLIAVNAFSFDGNIARADEVRAGLERMVVSIPVLTRIADSDLQRDALAMLALRARALTVAIDEVAHNYEERGRILSEELGPSQATMSAAIDRLIASSREHEENLRRQSHDQLARLATVGAVSAVVLLVLGGWISTMIGLSIRRPLLDLREVMEAGARGDWSREVEDSNLNDELAAMARTIEVFRQHATDKSRLESERDEAESYSVAVNRGTLHDLLAQMEAHDSSGSFIPPLAAEPTTEAAEIAAAFTRILAKFQTATDERDAQIRVLTKASEENRATARARSDFLAALVARLRPLLDGLGAQARPVLHRLDAALDYSRLERGDVVPTPCEVDLVTVIATAIARAEDGKNRIEARIDPGLPPKVWADPVWLDRLLGLLLDHAASAAVERVRLFAERVVLDGTVAMPHLRVWVGNDGAGGADWVGTLLHPTPDSDAGDLDLALIRLLVEQLGGTIGGDVGAGLGSALWCVLPLEPMAGGVEIQPDPDCLIGKRVLVVAPDADERGLISLVAEQAGGAVVRVPGGREALAASARAVATRAPFDLVVAATLAIEPTQLEPLGMVPLVLIDDGDPLRRLALAGGAVCPGFIGRPLTRDQILAAVAAAARFMR